MPEALLVYKTLPFGVADAVVREAGSWLRFDIQAGWLKLAFSDAAGNGQAAQLFDAQQPPPLLEAQSGWRMLEASADIACTLCLLCRTEEYLHKKYGLPKTHSELIAAMPGLTAGKVLDVGCGRGRNALYLALQGFQVEAMDVNAQSLQVARQIQEEEKLHNLHIRQVDLNQQQGIRGEYDFILSTVVLMFLQPASIKPLIAQMQQATKTGGQNLIVAAMDSPDYPCREPFPFTFRAGQLRDYYLGWELLKYNEEVGHLHKTDAQGKPIALRFATLLARKGLPEKPPSEP